MNNRKNQKFPDEEFKTNMDGISPRKTHLVYEMEPLVQPEITQEYARKQNFTLGISYEASAPPMLSSTDVSQKPQYQDFEIYQPNKNISNETCVSFQQALSAKNYVIDFNPHKVPCLQKETKHYCTRHAGISRKKKTLLKYSKQFFTRREPKNLNLSLSDTEKNTKEATLSTLSTVPELNERKGFKLSRKGSKYKVFLNIIILMFFNILHTSCFFGIIIDLVFRFFSGFFLDICCSLLIVIIPLFIFTYVFMKGIKHLREKEESLYDDIGGILIDIIDQFIQKNRFAIIYFFIYLGLIVYGLYGFVVGIKKLQNFWLLVNIEFALRILYDILEDIYWVIKSVIQIIKTIYFDIFCLIEKWTKYSEYMKDKNCKSTFNFFAIIQKMIIKNIGQTLGR